MVVQVAQVDAHAFAEGRSLVAHDLTERVALTPHHAVDREQRAPYRVQLVQRPLMGSFRHLFLDVVQQLAHFLDEREVRVDDRVEQCVGEEVLLHATDHRGSGPDPFADRIEDLLRVFEDADHPARSHDDRHLFDHDPVLVVRLHELGDDQIALAVVLELRALAVVGEIGDRERVDAERVAQPVQHRAVAESLDVDPGDPGRHRDVAHLRFRRDRAFLGATFGIDERADPRRRGRGGQHEGARSRTRRRSAACEERRGARDLHALSLRLRYAGTFIPRWTAGRSAMRSIHFTTFAWSISGGAFNQCSGWSHGKCMMSPIEYSPAR